MTETSGLPAEIDGWLREIDQILAQQGYPLADRHMHAAVKLVEFGIIEIEEGGKRRPPGELKDFIGETWFAAIFRDVTKWYETRYAAAQKAARPKDSLKGVIMIFDTPFAIEVPKTSKQPGKPGETFWLCFHDRVQRAERPLRWIKDGPSLEALDGSQRRKAARLSREIANKLRYINIRLTGLTTKGAERGFHDAIFPHLTRAATAIVQGGRDELKRAHWDLQMACETALKLLSMRKGVKFKHVHDLTWLFDDLPAGLAIDRFLIAKMPDHKLMIEYRYGNGPWVPPLAVFGVYRLTLRIIEQIAGCLDVQMQLGRARFELQKPPWAQFL